MSSHATRIRGACEQCHRRKIRCILGANESKCVNCLHNNTDCFFAPRARPGRPRKDAGKVRRISRPAQEAQVSGNRTGNPIFTPPLPIHQNVDNMAELKVDSIEAEAAWSSMFWGELDDLSSSLSESFSFGYDNFVPSSDDSMATKLSGADASTVTSWSPLSPHPMLSSSPQPDELDFDAILQHCKRLDQYGHQMTRGVFTKVDEKEVFSIMTKLCTAAVTKTNSSGHCPSAALILAAVLKVLEVCGKLAVASTNSDIHYILSLKRIDMLLLQAKYFLSESGHHTAVNQAVELHHHIEAIITHTWPTFKW